MKPEIYLRADGSPEIGLGHIVRCFALAHMLKKKFVIIFVSREIPEQTKKEIQSLGFQLLNIKTEDEFFSKLNSTKIVVLDGYHFDLAYQKKIKLIGCKLVCIDDLHDKEFVADLIINHAPGVIPQDYKAQPYTKFALGLKYALLRPMFLSQAKKKRKIQEIKTILICFGGSDNKNLTKKTLDIVLTFAKFKKIIVITGAGYLYEKILIQSIQQDKRVTHYHSITEEQMLSLMLEANIGIVPASGILLEALATGLSVISGSYVDNQKFMLKGFLDAKSILSVNEFKSEYLYEIINNLNNITKLNHPFDSQIKNRIIKQLTLLTNDK
jgi:UDP-2,4-diacetamido-2,4,6-trideoxy-beta-L-altropyranose hydrolase